MLQPHLTTLLTVFLALSLTASANSHKKPHPPQTCDNTCLPAMRACTPSCKDSKHARHPIACAIACECQVAKNIAFCGEGCAFDCKGDWPAGVGEGGEWEETEGVGGEAVGEAGEER
ncbi:hypothetical protein C7974DRAFT_376858 [Boeremia exigua]|uniref:uncharacterized protein n=1 Tax=Boeremia exigua TaxID=749465 RepID=UPI001E8E035B|nr:uncharacterized protein C7974DRAFT_376858 [Boeremia exigua]KAH6625324.1 hypothetical protein C7974DRAFT_376858 [Boeremia exigua]